jgi:hypothetical protein
MGLHSASGIFIPLAETAYRESRLPSTIRRRILLKKEKRKRAVISNNYFDSSPSEGSDFFTLRQFPQPVVRKIVSSDFPGA